MSSVRQTESKKQLFDITTLFTQVFILVDDYFRQHPRQGVGRKPLFSDSEVVTLLFMMDFIPYPSERQYLAYPCSCKDANHLDLFPRLLEQSQFNVRARALRYRIERMRQHWHKKLVEGCAQLTLMPTEWL